VLPPINLKKWIDENRSLLKPPVGNQQVWQDREFMITLVGGPNQRTDYHINQGEEFFYQLEGEMNLRMVEKGNFIDFPIRAGEIFLLPPRVPHSPQRPANSVGLVIEHKRLENEKDGFVWFCEGCHHKLYEEFLHVTDLVKDLPPLFERFYSNPQATTCSKCGRGHSKK
jgi:3-hydroxyanthranilate 3,4-dioxygenase